MLGFESERVARALRFAARLTVPRYFTVARA